jgi:hypothetical protein
MGRPTPSGSSSATTAPARRGAGSPGWEGKTGKDEVSGRAYASTLNSRKRHAEKWRESSRHRKHHRAPADFRRGARRCVAESVLGAPVSATPSGTGIASRLGVIRRRRAERLAYLASALALASAALSVFWTLGGTFLLDTVGGSIETLARARSPAALVLGTATSLVKVATALLALALVRPWDVAPEIGSCCWRTRWSARCSSPGVL